MTVICPNFIYWKHLNTKVFEVQISNGRSMDYFLCTRPTIQILPDQCIRKQNGTHLSRIQKVWLSGIQMTENWYGPIFRCYGKSIPNSDNGQMIRCQSIKRPFSDRLSFITQMMGWSGTVVILNMTVWNCGLKKIKFQLVRSKNGGLKLWLQPVEIRTIQKLNVFVSISNGFRQFGSNLYGLKNYLDCVDSREKNVWTSAR